MKKNWPTKDKDVHIAQKIMQEYAPDGGLLSMFELVLNEKEKRMKFRLSNWVVALAKQFNSMYGSNQGEYVTRQVIASCMTEGQTLH